MSVAIQTSIQVLDPNDDFGAAAAVSLLPYSDARNTRLASAAADDPTCAGRVGKTVWYSFTPGTSGRIDADTFGSNHETTLSVYTGARGALTQVACNERSQGFQSRVVFSAIAGRPGTSLAGKVAAARAALASGHAGGACAILRALGHQVIAQRGKSITEQRAAELLAAASRIRAVLGC